MEANKELNGWYVVKGEEDLPKESGDYFIYTERFKKIVIMSFNPLSEEDVRFYLDYITHYKEITYPKPPM